MRTEAEITANWPEAGAPVLSICCFTFNHERFIDEALKGFLMQETVFPFEIVIHDDASTDRTPEIIRTYQTQYPSLIKAIFQEENQFSKGYFPWDFVQRHLGGKYVALCEGDDYWTDPKKLQIQVDFLEQHPEYAISGHDTSAIDQDGRLISRSQLAGIHKRDYEKRDLACGWASLPTLSWVYRNAITHPVPEMRMVWNVDTFILALLSSFGKSHYHHDIKPAMYRVHSGGIWSTLDDERRFEHRINTWFWLYRYHKRVGQNDYAGIVLQRFYRHVLEKVPISELFRELALRFVWARQIRGVLGRLKRALM